MNNKDKAYSIAKLQEAYYKNIETFYLILNDGVKATSSNLKADVKTEKTAEELIEDIFKEE